jgi:hypothetical protein
MKPSALMQLSNNNYNSGTSYCRWNHEKGASTCTGNGLKQKSTDFSKFQKLPKIVGARRVV